MLARLRHRPRRRPRCRNDPSKKNDRAMESTGVMSVADVRRAVNRFRERLEGTHGVVLRVDVPIDAYAAVVAEAEIMATQGRHAITDEALTNTVSYQCGKPGVRTADALARRIRKAATSSSRRGK